MEVSLTAERVRSTNSRRAYRNRNSFRAPSCFLGKPDEAAA
jgi:hypothetical protein